MTFFDFFLKGVNVFTLRIDYGSESRCPHGARTEQEIHLYRHFNVVLLTLQDIKKNSSCSVENNWSPLLDRCFARGLFWRHLILNCLFVHSLGQWSLRLNYHKRLWTNWKYYVATIWIQPREKVRQSSHLHEFKIFEVNHTEVASCFGKQAQIEQKMNKIIFALRFSSRACLFAQNFFHENELSLWKKKSGFKNDWLLCHCLQCSNSILNGICITAHGESYLFSPLPLLLEPNCQKYIFCINMILSPL